MAYYSEVRQGDSFLPSATRENDISRLLNGTQGISEVPITAVVSSSDIVFEAGISVSAVKITEIEDEVEVEYWEVTLTPSDSFFIQNKYYSTQHTFYTVNETVFKLPVNSSSYVFGIFPYLDSLLHNEVIGSPEPLSPSGYCFGFVPTGSWYGFYNNDDEIVTSDDFLLKYVLIDRPITPICIFKASTGSITIHNQSATFVDCSYYGWFNFVNVLYNSTYQWYLLSGKATFGIDTAYLQATMVADDNCYVIATYDDDTEALVLAVSNTSTSTTGDQQVWYISSKCEYPSGLLVTGRLEP